MAHNIRKSQKTKIQDKSAIFWEFRAENPFSEVPQSSCIVWDTQGPFLRHVYFFVFRTPDKNQQKYAESATCFRSLGENSPEDPAQVKERPT